jgi:hypothetical protein
MAEQRIDLADSLANLSSQIGLPAIEVEFEEAPATVVGYDAQDAAEPKALLSRMAKAEAADYEILTTIAGTFLPFSNEAAEILASQAEAARKRSSWAQDQLDLLNL